MAVILVLGGMAAISTGGDGGDSQPVNAFVPTTTVVSPTTSVAFPTTTVASPPATVTSPAITSPATTVTSPATTVPSPATTVPATVASGSLVVSVTDGDTLVVEVAAGEERLRLIGINAPESDECFAAEAAVGLTSLVEHQIVRLETDRSDRDQFGRLLRYVYLDDLFVNEWLVEQGFAIARRYPPDTAMADRLDAAQDRAEAASRGLWATEACGPAASGAISVGTIRYDADGNDNHNLNDEWVELVNEGGAALDLTGWSVKDESASHRYSIPGGFTLGAGRTVRLHTGCGSDTDDWLYWCNQGSAIWNNDGDTVFVIDPSGNVATSQSY